MRSKKEIEFGLLKLYEKERKKGNKKLTSSRMLPRTQGKINALRWVLKQTEMLDPYIETLKLKQEDQR